MYTERRGGRLAHCTDLMPPTRLLACLKYSCPEAASADSARVLTTQNT